MTLTLVTVLFILAATAAVFALRARHLRCSRCGGRAALYYAHPAEGRTLCPTCEAAENEAEYRARRCSRCGVGTDACDRWSWCLHDGYRCAPCVRAAFEEACEAASCATCGGRPVTQFFDGSLRCEEHAWKSMGA